MEVVFRKITMHLTRCEFFLEAVVIHWKIKKKKKNPGMDAGRAPATAATP